MRSGVAGDVRDHAARVSDRAEDDGVSKGRRAALAIIDRGSWKGILLSARKKGGEEACQKEAWQKMPSSQSPIGFSFVHPSYFCAGEEEGEEGMGAFSGEGLAGI
jgi:hypothetical protein